MGVDVWVRRSRAPEPGVAGDEPVPQAQPAVSGALPAAAVPAVTDPATAGGEVDPAAMDWAALRAGVRECRRCELRAGCTQTVFGVGNERADWMVIGEAPGADEDRQGEPFVGRAGQLLNAMLAGIGLARGEVFIANILKCRPPGNRDPRPQEAAACQPWLKRQIALVRPKIILAVGRIAAQNLLGTDTPIGKMRGRRFSYGETGIPVVVVYHPAYLLRSPAEKRKAYEDLLAATRVYAEVK
ncbi:MAG: uracil-DNA glycosylase family protein [Gammaproteobacteria bacterium]